MSKFETTPTLNSGTGYGLFHAHFVGDFQVYIKQKSIFSFLFPFICSICYFNFETLHPQDVACS